MALTILKNARIFASSSDSDELIPGYLLIADGQINHIGRGEDETFAQSKSQGATEIDLKNQVVIPSFIDGHVHFLGFGLSLGKFDILLCNSLEEIRQNIRTYAKTHPLHSRVLVKGWRQTSTQGQALASWLDGIDPRPIYIEAFDQHSAWCNSAALEELGVSSMQDPPGGTIHRDEKGRPSGLLSENAYLSLVIPFLTKELTMDEKQVALERAFTAYTESGYTGIIDMAMDEDQWEALQLFRERRGLPLHVAAYWLVPYSDTDAEIQEHLDKAIAMNSEFSPSSSPSFCVTGIKLIADGVVDGCTAALSQPYRGQSDPVEPIWPGEKLAQVVSQADEAGLQCAIHAIGDRTITQAIDAYVRLGKAKCRHRIEHLELTSAEDAKRLGQHGIIASVQPVHSDPVLSREWPHLIGHDRCKRAFAYREFLEGGSRLTFGTDVPTAAHLPLPNLYNATTRRSAIEPESLERRNAQFAVSLAAGAKAATINAAYSRYAETWTGSLAQGKCADFVVLDTDWTPDGLLKARVQQTWYRGRKLFDVQA